MKLLAYVAVSTLILMNFPISAQEMTDRATQSDERAVAVDRGPQRATLSLRGAPRDLSPEEIMALPQSGETRQAVARARTSDRRSVQLRQAVTQYGGAAAGAGGMSSMTADLGGIETYTTLDFTKWEWIKPNQIYLSLYNLTSINPEMNFIRARVDKWEQGYSMASVHFYVSQNNVGKPHVVTIDIDFSQAGELSLYDNTEESSVMLAYQGGEMSIHELTLPEALGRHTINLTFLKPESIGEHRLLSASVSVVDN